MAQATHEFQVFVKPVGNRCNLACQYCYYLKNEHLSSQSASVRMTDDLLELYIIQHLAAAPEPIVRFSWHGGEPTLLGLNYFRKIITLQRQYQAAGRRICNGLQTNGTLLNPEWCHFLAQENFTVGISLDGPPEMHNQLRVTKDQQPTHARTLRGYELLQEHDVPNEILCVVHAGNVQYAIDVYRYFKRLKAQYISFLPLVERQPDLPNGVTASSVAAEAWGSFLCAIFDEWMREDIGRIKIQIFEEAARTAFGQEHSLCLFRPVCGGVPVLEHNGDVYSCDHFVAPQHRLGNIQVTPLIALIESPAQRAFGADKLRTLPHYCQVCEVRAMCNGECPKNRFQQTPDGETGLNYLCAGYRRFFNHCRPFVAAVAAEWHRQHPIDSITRMPNPGARMADAKPHRNDPCPCGSGLKYKKCCLGKQN